MSTKRDHSNRDAEDSKRQGQNTSGQGPTRGAHSSSNADKAPAKTSDGSKGKDGGQVAKEPGRGAK